MARLSQVDGATAGALAGAARARRGRSAGADCRGGSSARCLRRLGRGRRRRPGRRRGRRGAPAAGAVAGPGPARRARCAGRSRGWPGWPGARRAPRRPAQRQGRRSAVAAPRRRRGHGRGHHRQEQAGGGAEGAQAPGPGEPGPGHGGGGCRLARRSRRSKSDRRGDRRRGARACSGAGIGDGERAGGLELGEGAQGVAGGPQLVQVQAAGGAGGQVSLEAAPGDVVQRPVKVGVQLLAQLGVVRRDGHR